MRYYCKKCGSEFRPAPHLEAYFQDSTVDHCPICLKEGEGLYAAVPDFETPEQYENRTKECWPDNAPVWYRPAGIDNAPYGWECARYEVARMEADFSTRKFEFVCAQGPEAPPDGWRPE
jgi:hypothetical protein